MTLDARPGRWMWWSVLGALSCAAYVAAELYILDGKIGFPLDDSWIHLQFAKQMAAGQGLAYNDGELVVGSTAPLWTALLTIGFMLPGSPVVWAKLLGLVAHVLVIAGAWRLSRELGMSNGLAAGAAILTALTGWLTWSALAGMETGLFAALSLEGIRLHVRERRRSDPGPCLSLPLLCLGVLLRPEGLLLVALAVGDRLVRWRRADDGLRLEAPDWATTAGGLVVGALVVVPVLAFFWWVGGSPLPSTFDTKAGYAPPGVPSPQYYFVVLGILFQAQAVPTLLAAAGVVELISRTGDQEDRGLLPALWVVALPVAYSVLSANTSSPLVGNFGRYFFPLLPLVVVLGLLGLNGLWSRVPAWFRIGSVGVPWRPALFLVVGGLTAWSWTVGIGRYVQSVANVTDSDVRMAQLLREVMPEEAVLAVNDIGALKYHLPNRVVDLAGIATPEVHEWTRRARDEGRPWQLGLYEFLDHSQPDYIVVFPAWFGRIADDPRFIPLIELEVPDNITMGGDELVLYATPWTRYPLEGGGPPADHDQRRQSE